MSFAVLLLVLVFAGARDQEQPPSARLMNVAPSFALPDAEGKRHLLAEYEGGRGLVILFVSSDSKICQSYLSRLASLEKDFVPNDIRFLVIDVAPSLSPAKVQRLYRAAGMQAPILHDPDLSVARWYNIHVVPTAFLLDTQKFVRYLGQVDDAEDEKRVTRSPLRRALESYCHGQEITEKEVSPHGSILRLK